MYMSVYSDPTHRHTFLDVFLCVVKHGQQVIEL